MGLEDKRKIKALEDTVLPVRTAELLEITGTALVYEVDWASFAGDMEALNFMDNLACHRLNMALRTICVDQLARDAIAASLARVKIKNVATKDAMHLGVADRALEIHEAFALRTDGMFSDREIVALLMKHL